MPSKTLLLETKKFAVHDGPGIRSVLFLKGCPLQCKWCHNPESISPKPELAYYEHKCIHCGECVPVCPEHAHNMKDDKHFFDRKKCTACGACEEVCLGRALKLFGREISVAEACDIVLEDRDFYEPDGGVTMSGGEPLLQAVFCVELFKSLKKEGIHCAIDTCGAVPWRQFETVLPYTDIFLYDLKHVDEQLHIEYTGLSNKLVLENLKKLSQHNVPIEIRIPVIPGFNDDPESINSFQETLSELSNISAVKLLPYHDFARSKFTAIGKADTMPEAPAPSDEQMQELENRFKKFN